MPASPEAERSDVGRPRAPRPRTLEPIFSPASIAVIGASRKPDSLSYALLHNLLVGQYDGTIYPVNPNERAVHSLRCYPNVSAIPDPVDLAIVIVPKRIVPGVIDECLANDVKGLVVITAGFREVGEQGAAAEAEILARVRAAGVRMIGPNCMGVINADPSVRMNATFAPTAALPGSVGFVSQSGALGVAILNVAAGVGIGFTQFASMGNKADVSGNDLLEFWEDDPATRVIAMYLESFGNPRRFTQIAKRVSRKKPILVVKSGRTREGARAASSHTGALAGTDVTISAFLEQSGVIRANTIEEMFDIALALDRCPFPRGNRVAVVTNAGGPAIMATDSCVTMGLEMATFTDESREQLRRFLPDTASVANPIDMIASAQAEDYLHALRVVLADPNVDSVLAIQVTPPIADTLDVLDAIIAASRELPEKPIAVVMMATEESYAKIRHRGDRIAIYQFPESAVLALARLTEYGRFKRRPEDEKIPSFETDDDRVRACLDACDSGYLDVASAFGVLEAYGIPTAPWRFVPAADDVVERVALAARQVGYPLVLKAVGKDLVHKSDVGAVALDLRTAEDLTAAIARMRAGTEEAGVEPDGFLLQQHVRGGHEVIFGLSTDPRLGPMLMFGLGGKYVEVFQDIRFAVPPLTESDALRVVRGIRGRALLEGVRGEKPVDMEHLAEMLLRLAQLVERHPRISELDVNPFLASADPAVFRAVDVRIRVGAPTASDSESTYVARLDSGASTAG